MCSKLILLRKKYEICLTMGINALDVYTKINIKDYLARPEQSLIKSIHKREKIDIHTQR